MPASQDLPGKLRRSPKKALRTCVKAHDAVVKECGERAHHTALTADRHSFEKVGDHSEPVPAIQTASARSSATGR